MSPTTCMHLAAWYKHYCLCVGVGQTTVYKYKKVQEIEFSKRNRKRRSDANDRQPWWPKALRIFEEFWKVNSDESPIVNDVSWEHDETDRAHHALVPIPEKPGLMERICVGGHCKSHQTWNAHGCDSFMYRLFLEQYPDWAIYITKETLIESKFYWIKSPKNQ